MSFQQTVSVRSRLTFLAGWVAVIRIATGAVGITSSAIVNYNLSDMYKPSIEFGKKNDDEDKMAINKTYVFANGMVAVAVSVLLKLQGNLSRSLTPLLNGWNKAVPWSTASVKP